MHRCPAAGFVLSAALLGAMVLVEQQRRLPMIDLTLFRNRAFSAASAAVTVAFLPLFGFIFLIMVVMGIGLGLTTTPATESIMSAVSPQQAGVGSAMNDAAREIGGTLGVAVLGSVFTSMYGSRVVTALAGLPPGARHAARQSVGPALQLPARSARSRGRHGSPPRSRGSAAAGRRPCLNRRLPPLFIRDGRAKAT